MKNNAVISNLQIVTVSEGTPEHPRSSEGSLIELATGELFMVFQRWDASGKGSEDDGPNKLVSVRSRDGGRTWGDLRVEAVPEPGDVNVYCPNLIRLEDGACIVNYWAMKYSPKWTFHGLIHLRTARFNLKGSRP